MAFKTEFFVSVNNKMMRIYQRSKGQRLYKQQVKYEMQVKNKYEKGPLKLK